MKITVHSSKAVKPNYGTCGNAGASPPSTAAAVVPLNVLDKANVDTYVSFIYAFHPPAPPNAVLEAGLARALVEYREWARRFGVDARGGRAIMLNDVGAHFVEATADVVFDAVMPLRPTPDVLNLHPSGDDGPEELMLIQVTWFACGSLVVGFTAQHSVADGRATSNFFLAWGQATCGAAIDPVPVHNRASFFPPRATLQVEHEHRGVEFKPYENVGSVAGGHVHDDEVVVSKVHFSREFISKLKSQATSSVGAHRPYITLQCVVAHLWRCMTMARGLDGREATSACIAVDGRARMSPQVPEGYTGNVVLWARPTTTARELVSRPLQHVVELINWEVARIDDAYFKSFIDFASSRAAEKERLVPTADAAEMVLSPNVEVDSCLRIPFYDLDFGSGWPFFFMPSYLPVEGVVFLLPSFSGDGSVDAYVPFFSRDMDTFNYYCYSLGQKFQICSL